MLKVVLIMSGSDQEPPTVPLNDDRRNELEKRVESNKEKILELRGKVDNLDSKREDDRSLMLDFIDASLAVAQKNYPWTTEAIEKVKANAIKKFGSDKGASKKASSRKINSNKGANNGLGIEKSEGRKDTGKINHEDVPLRYNDNGTFHQDSEINDQELVFYQDVWRELQVVMNNKSELAKFNVNLENTRLMVSDV